MDRSRLTALRLEAERQLRRELQNRYPDLAADFDVRLAERSAYNGTEDSAAPPQHIDW